MRERVIELLWNRESHRPRLPIRFVSVFVVLVVLSAGFALIDPYLRVSLQTTFDLLSPGAQATVAANNVIFLGTQSIAVIGAVYLTGRFIDRRWFRDFGLHIDRLWWRDLGFGLVLGAGLITVIFLIEYAAGWVVVSEMFWINESTFGFWPWLGFSLLTFIAIGFTEELLARGYLIKNLGEGLTWSNTLQSTSAVVLAVIGSSLLFAAGHIMNPNAGLASTAGILIASFMLAAGYVLTGELAIPIGIHITWNFFQGTVFGFPVSGLDFGVAIIAVEQRGPAIMTGGSFGPEAGLLGVLASLLGTILIVGWVYRRDGQLRVHPSICQPDLRTRTQGE